MRSIKVLMDVPNYFAIGHVHVFFNFNAKNFNFINSLPPNAARKIHVFITNHQAINYHLCELVRRYTGEEAKKNHRNIKIVLHFFKEDVTDQNSLVSLFKLTFKDLMGRFYWSMDKHDVVFSDERNKNYKASIIYTKNFLRVKFGGKNYGTISARFPEYEYNVDPDSERDNSGIFETLEERLNPEIFRDKLIAAFKEKCPKGILKGFKDNNDIWDFIMNNSEFKMKEE